MSLSKEQQANGVVCASAGNHAQGVAYSCYSLDIRGVIFMPNPTPSQKVQQVKMFGKDKIEVVLVGDTFDDANSAALEYCKNNGMTYVPPFDDVKIIEGQGTIGLEILEDSNEKIDYVFVPVGGGGLSSGLCILFNELSPETKIIGVEPEGAPSMKKSLEENRLVTLENIDKFVDGAAVQRVGEIPFSICKNHLSDMLLVPEGKVCTTILRLYNRQAIVVEPAGALTITALDQYREQIKGKNVVCIISGSNNDITRTEEMKERSLLYEGLKHYFLVRFPQRAGALREFLTEVLGSEDDITLFEYRKKSHRELGPALIGIEIPNKDELPELFRRLEAKKIAYEYLNEKPDLFQYVL